MLYDLPRETRIALGIGVIVFIITFLLGLVVWIITLLVIIHHRKRICKHEQFCTLCDNGHCIKCDGHKEVVRPERVENDMPYRKVEDNCIIICKNGGK